MAKVTNVFLQNGKIITAWRELDFGYLRANLNYTLSLYGKEGCMHIFKTIILRVPMVKNTKSVKCYSKYCITLVMIIFPFCEFLYTMSMEVDPNPNRTYLIFRSVFHDHEISMLACR